MGIAVLLLREDSLGGVTSAIYQCRSSNLFTKERVEMTSGDFSNTATINQGAEEKEIGSVGKDD